jgi:hypothetical protein
MLNQRGLFVINTFKQLSWQHDEANRKITLLDIIVNMVLYFIVVAAVVIR